MSENAPLKQETKVAIIIDLCAQMENYSVNLETKDKQATILDKIYRDNDTNTGRTNDSLAPT